MAKTFLQYHLLGNTDRFLDFLANADWRAGAYMRQRLVDGTFYQQFGETAALYFLVDGEGENDPIVGFIALLEQDFNPIPEFRPWIAFAYIDPAYRGQHLLATMIEHLEGEARAAGWPDVHIVTRLSGLYERYGYTLIREVASEIHGRDYVYEKKLA